MLEKIGLRMVRPPLVLGRIYLGPGETFQSHPKKRLLACILHTQFGEQFKEIHHLRDLQYMRTGRIAASYYSISKKQMARLDAELAQQAADKRR